MKESKYTYKNDDRVIITSDKFRFKRFEILQVKNDERVKIGNKRYILVKNSEGKSQYVALKHLVPLNHNAFYKSDKKNRIYEVGQGGYSKITNAKFTKYEFLKIVKVIDEKTLLVQSLNQAVNPIETKYFRCEK